MPSPSASAAGARLPPRVGISRPSVCCFPAPVGIPRSCGSGFSGRNLAVAACGGNSTPLVSRLTPCGSVCTAADRPVRGCRLCPRHSRVRIGYNNERTTPMVPEILPATVAAMAQDPYLSIPAIDDDLWQGNDDPDARSTFHDEWCFCWSPSDGRIAALHESFVGAIFVPGLHSEWQEQ